MEESSCRLFHGTIPTSDTKHPATSALTDRPKKIYHLSHFGEKVLKLYEHIWRSLHKNPVTENQIFSVAHRISAESSQLVKMHGHVLSVEPHLFPLSISSLAFFTTHFPSVVISFCLTVLS